MKEIRYKQIISNESNYEFLCDIEHYLLHKVSMYGLDLEIIKKSIQQNIDGYIAYNTVLLNEMKSKLPFKETYNVYIDYKGQELETSLWEAHKKNECNSSFIIDLITEVLSYPGKVVKLRIT